MARISSRYRLFIGIDVSATTCAVAWMALQAQPTRAITIKQTPAGFAELERQLLAIEPDPDAVLIVMEATGTYWMRLASSLSEAGFAVSVINPAQAASRVVPTQRHHTLSQWVRRSIPRQSSGNKMRHSLCVVISTAWAF